MSTAPRSLSGATHLCIHLERKHDFWRAVPPGGNVLRHQPDLFPLRGRGLDAPSQAKVAHFEIAVRIEQKVSWLQIPMDDIRAMNRLEGPENLINKVLAIQRSDRCSLGQGRRYVLGSDHQSTVGS